MAEFRTLKLGGGGFLNNQAFANDGTHVIGTDTCGCYIKNALGIWEFLLTSTRMPDATQNNASGYCWGIDICRTDSNVIYHLFKGMVYKSIDKGLSFATTAITSSADVSLDTSAAFTSRLLGPHLAVDPNHSGVVISSYQLDYAKITTNGGTSWADITGVPKSGYGFVINHTGGYPIGATSLVVGGGTGLALPDYEPIYFDGSTTAVTIQPGGGLAAGVTSGTIAVSPLPVAVANGAQLKNARGHAIAFDPGSTDNGTQTQIIYIHCWGKGVYKSTDGGTSWSLLTGSPKTYRRITVSNGGNCYITSDGGEDVNAYKCTRAGTSFSVLSGSGLGGFSGQAQVVAVPSGNENRIVVIYDGGAPYQSIDGGATWFGAYFAGANNDETLGFPVGSMHRIATDVPYLAVTKEDYLSTSTAAFDPLDPTKLYWANGIGVWWATLPTTYVGFRMYSQTAGIENLVTNQFLSPRGGDPLVACWDRAFFKIDDPDTYRTGHGPFYDTAIRDGWGLDHAKSDPTFIVGQANLGTGGDRSAYSTSGGAPGSWVEFPNHIAAQAGGCIACSTPNSIISVGSNQQEPWYTLDRAASAWIKSNPVTPQFGETGYGFAYYFNRHIVASDSETALKYVLYNYGPNGNSNSDAGFYVTTNGGVTWSFVGPGEIPYSSYNASLHQVPSYGGGLASTAGHHIFTSGPDLLAISLYYTRNSWAARSTISRVTEVEYVGFGKEAPGKDYPTIYFSGKVDGVRGFWQGIGSSADWAATGNTGTGIVWTNMKPGDFPLGRYDRVKTVCGDANIFGRFYIGYSGSGALYYNEGGGGGGGPTVYFRHRHV